MWRSPIFHTEPTPRPFDWLADFVVPFAMCLAIVAGFVEVGVAVFALVHGGAQ